MRLFPNCRESRLRRLTSELGVENNQKLTHGMFSRIDMLLETKISNGIKQGLAAKPTPRRLKT